MAGRGCVRLQRPRLKRQREVTPREASERPNRREADTRRLTRTVRTICDEGETIQVFLWLRAGDEDGEDDGDPGQH